MQTTRLDLVPGTLCDERMWSRLAPLMDAGFEFNYVPLYEAKDRPQMQRMVSEHRKLAAGQSGGVFAGCVYRAGVRAGASGAREVAGADRRIGQGPGPKGKRPPRSHHTAAGAHSICGAVGRAPAGDPASGAPRRPGSHRPHTADGAGPRQGRAADAVPGVDGPTRCDGPAARD